MRTALLALLLTSTIGLFLFTQRHSTQLPQNIYPGVSYQGVTDKYQVTLVTDKLSAPSRIRITPDSRHLLVAQVTGEVVSLDRDGAGWSRPYLLTRIDTGFPGFPPEEGGLVGITISDDFQDNGRLFFLYSYKQKDGVVQNRISAAVVSEKSGRLTAASPRQIFQANIPGAGSHQITDAVSLKKDGQSYLAFAIGEGFHGERAQDPQLEAGKIIIIKEDGGDPKIAALGIRNAYVLANVPQKPGKFIIADTGPDKYDRLIYTNLGTDIKQNFLWDGDQEKLALPVPDPTNPRVKDQVLFRLLPQTLTFTGLKFIPDSDQFLAVVFGKTGSPENSPGKEIWLGKLTDSGGQPKISFEPAITRVPGAEGKLGNPIGLEVDPKTGVFYFADILEGRLYQITLKGGDK